MINYSYDGYGRGKKYIIKFEYYIFWLWWGLWGYLLFILFKFVLYD